MAQTDNGDVASGKTKSKKAIFKESVFDIRLPAGLGISLIDDTPRELLYLSARGIRLRFLCCSSCSCLMP
jgi:hypothetical protein